MASVWGGSWGTVWGNNWGAITTTSQPVLPIRRVQTRSIDAKSIADRYNAGQPVVADYEWPGGRKFYQDESKA